MMPMVMPPMVPLVMPIGISGLSHGMGHYDCGQDGTDHDGSDHRTICVARRWGCNRASRNDRRRAQSKQRFPH